MIDRISDGEGNFIYRPKEQDIKPKAFSHNAIFMITLFETPTERRLLWMIHHYPYIFNAFFLGDMLKQDPKSHLPDSKLSAALRVMHTLKMKGYINESKDHLKYGITLTGYVYRITSHAGFTLGVALFAASIAITFGLLNYFKKPPITGNTQAPKQEIKKDRTKEKHDDSVLYNPVQTDSGKVKDFSLMQHDTTK